MHFTTHVKLINFVSVVWIKITKKDGICYLTTVTFLQGGPMQGNVCHTA
jgi:hypothetical protein